MAVHHVEYFIFYTVAYLGSGVHGVVEIAVLVSSM